MSKVRDVLRPFWLSGINEVAQGTNQSFKGWLNEEEYLVSGFTDNTSAVELFPLNMVAVVSGIAHDVDRFGAATFETIAGIGSHKELPGSHAWPLIRSYYAAFYAAHGISRIFARSITNLNFGETNALRRVGPRTLAMLNIPVSRRVEQIVANMERRRWLPRSFERRYVVVNIPDAMLDVLANGQVVLSSRVIVGRPVTPTPVFRAEIVGITANPPWNVPASIARNEMLPLLRGDPMYLADRNMILTNGPEGDPHGLTIEWNAVERTAFPYQIRQLPGPDNALGRIKFEPPNRFSVYLHDTPARNLFARMERFFSHGCIRVEEVQSIASYLLEGGPEAPDALERALDAEETVLLPLQEPVPVYILYLTAVRNRDGTFGFRHDIYGEDEEFIAMLAGRAASSFPALAADFGCPAAG